jgi:NADH:ubiquinone oxidoreductase subunit 3 (subunit A)
MKEWLLLPPVVFVVVLFSLWLLAFLFSRLAFRAKKQAQGTSEAYACGEKNYEHRVQPDYSGFFSFVFFFTLAHVATLVMASVSVVTQQVLVLAVIYAISAMIGLYILLRS